MAEVTQHQLSSSVEAIDVLKAGLLLHIREYPVRDHHVVYRRRHQRSIISIAFGKIDEDTRRQPNYEDFHLNPISRSC